jgi:hypothetical protein
MWGADVDDVGSERREQRLMITERRYAPPLMGLRRRRGVHVAHPH